MWYIGVLATQSMTFHLETTISYASSDSLADGTESMRISESINTNAFSINHCGMRCGRSSSHCYYFCHCVHMQMAENKPKAGCSSPREEIGHFNVNSSTNIDIRSNRYAEDYYGL